MVVCSLLQLANLMIFVRKMQAEHQVSKGGSRVKAGLSQLDKWGPCRRRAIRECLVAIRERSSYFGIAKNEGGTNVAPDSK